MAHARPLSAEERDLLAWVARRNFDGPITASPARDRLRRLGLIEASQNGLAANWKLSTAGHAELAKDAAA